MKISEVLVESQLQEGPLGNIAGAIGRGVGKTVGGVAKGIGAVAGGIAGIGKAFKKGYHAGQGTVAGDDEDEPATKPAGGGGGAADRKSTRLNSSHPSRYRMPSSA